MQPVNVSRWQPSLVTLHTGEQVASDSQEWLAECQAQRVLDMPTREDRREWLDKWEKRHGTPSRKALEARIVAIWEARKRQSAGLEPAKESV